MSECESTKTVAQMDLKGCSVRSDGSLAHTMRINIRQITGNWDLGFVLDKHVVSSSYIGDNEFGRPQFDTTRSEVGEALFRLKYRGDWHQLDPLARELAASICPKFSQVGFIVPMPPSIVRARQPVTELARALGVLIGRPVFDNLVVKIPNGKQLKNMKTKEEKTEALKGVFSINDAIRGEGPWNALLVDDLFDTGASLDAICVALRGYPKVRKIFVAALTWK